MSNIFLEMLSDMRYNFNLKVWLDFRTKQFPSLSALARHTGIARSTLSRIYNNHTIRIDLRTLNRLCEALQCHPGDLFKPDVPLIDRPEARARSVKALAD
jgi:DNA-binding Xre family transcriptional regulator